MWYQNILDHMEGGVIRTRDGLILNWNKGAERIYKYAESEMIGKPITSLLVPEGKHEMAQMLDLVRYEEVPSLEMQHTRKDGQGIYVWLTFIPNREGQQDVQTVTLIVRDITGQKRIDAQMCRLEELNLIGQMSASLSHEIRNPMSVVKGFLQILSEKNELALYTEYIDLMISEIERVDSMMSEFLAFGRPYTGNLKRQNLNDIIGLILPILKANAGESNKQVLFDLEEIPDLELNANEIRQVVLNLVRNGLEAMSGEGVVRLKTYCEGNKVVLSVQDQGTGINPQIMDNLGAPFLTTKETGTGLGLSVCYRIVAKHHAVIEVSTGANGTTFYIRFQST